MVANPMDSSLTSVFLPMPGTSRIFNGSRNVETFSGRTTVNPSGFLKSDAIFDINLFGVMPTEHVILYLLVWYF